VSVPAGSSATVYVPAAASQRFVAVRGAATPIGREDGYQVFAVAPGDVEFQQGAAVGGSVGGSVPPTLSLTLGAPATFGAFVPGVDRDYTASMSATVISTAGDASLTVDGGKLTNGAFSLAEPLRTAFSRSNWSAPVSNDPVAITLKQHIGANEPLRTGSYTKSLTFTLSTTTP
jgi:hypothetical protein